MSRRGWSRLDRALAVTVEVLMSPAGPTGCFLPQGSGGVGGVGARPTVVDQETYPSAPLAAGTGPLV